VEQLSQLLWEEGRTSGSLRLVVRSCLLALFLPDTQVLLELETLLKNPLIEQTYTEKFGKYNGISRIVIKKFHFYFKQIDHEIVIIAVLFPGESKE